MNKKNIDLIRQALGAAESSIRLAKQLLNDIESGKVENSNNHQVNQPSDQNKTLPGITGSFDGENMVTASGETFSVPANYASKSMLVVGDTLKMVEEGKEKRFKQIEHVKRYRTTGIITKKDGKWKAITPEGSYKVLPVTIEHLGIDVGSEVVLHLPANNLTVSYAAIESVKNANAKPQPVAASQPSEEKKEEKLEAPKKEIEKTPSIEKEVKEAPKVEPKAVAKPELPKKEVVEEKLAKEPKKEEKPKVEEQPKVSAHPPKPEPVKQPEPKPKVEPVVTETPPAAAPAPKPAEPVTVPAAETKPMEISPEEDELT